VDTLALEQDRVWTEDWASHIGPHLETVTVTLAHEGQESG